MKTKEQKVETYTNIQYAKQNMKRNIEDGWFIHTCMSAYYSEKTSRQYVNDDILVVYERELETCN